MGRPVPPNTGAWPPLIALSALSAHQKTDLFSAWRSERSVHAAKSRGSGHGGLSKVGDLPSRLRKYGFVRCFLDFRRRRQEGHSAFAGPVYTPHRVLLAGPSGIVARLWADGGAPLT